MKRKRILTFKELTLLLSEREEVYIENRQFYDFV
jgi:hypothetical protein